MGRLDAFFFGLHADCSHDMTRRLLLIAPSLAAPKKLSLFFFRLSLLYNPRAYSGCPHQHTSSPSRMTTSPDHGCVVPLHARAPIRPMCREFYAPGHEHRGPRPPTGIVRPGAAGHGEHGTLCGPYTWSCPLPFCVHPVWICFFFLSCFFSSFRLITQCSTTTTTTAAATARTPTRQRRHRRQLLRTCEDTNNNSHAAAVTTTATPSVWPRRLGQ